MEQDGSQKAGTDGPRSDPGVLDQPKEGTFEVDLEYRLVGIDQEGAVLAGFPDVETALSSELDIADLFQNPEDLQRILETLEENGAIEGYVCRMFNVRQELRWVEASVTYMRGGDGEVSGFSGSFRDLTLHRDSLHAELMAALGRLERSESELLRTNEELEVLNRNLREYSAAVTHDLRAPLGAVKGFAEALLDEFEAPLGDRGRHMVQRIHYNALQMDRIIRGLRELVLLGVGRGTLEQLDPVREMRAAVDNRLAEIEKLGVALVIQTGFPAVAVHPARFFQLLDNLLSNALKHLDGVVEPRLRFGCGEPCPPGTFYVEDNGPGVAEKHREKIFELFYRTDRRQPGVGLGLAIVRRVVDSYGGRVWVEPVEGGGARFCFTLPDALSR